MRKLWNVIEKGKPIIGGQKQLAMKNLLISNFYIELLDRLKTEIIKFQREKILQNRAKLVNFDDNIRWVVVRMNRSQQLLFVSSRVSSSKNVLARIKKLQQKQITVLIIVLL